MRKPLAILALVFLAACGPAAHVGPAGPPGSLGRPAEAKQVGPGTFGPETIDTALRAAWKRENVVPAPRADDATFLRRVTLDVTGTIPAADQVTAFVTSTAPDKRRAVVKQLVASPAWAEHWASYWYDVLMGSGRLGQAVDRETFERWLVARFVAHDPWDSIVRDLVDARGASSDGAGDAREDVNGAVNWTLRFREAPQDLAGSASRVFLGVQIQCAQCHDHKTEKWTQDDFRGFASAFLRAKVTPIDRTKGMQSFRLEGDERPPPRYAKMEDLAPVAKARPRALDGTDLEAGKETRRALAAWMTSPRNPWFARAFVNRMWGHFLGRGFVDPVDDMRPTNTPVLPEVLDAIAADFVAHGYDVGHLVETICATEAYQLAASAEARPDAENKLWGRFHLVPLGPEEILNAVLRATRVEDAAQGPKASPMRAQLSKQVRFLFDVDEEDDTPDYEGTVSQALALMNGALVGNGARALPGSAVAGVLAATSDDGARVERLALQVLSRKPTPEEKAAWVAYVTGASRPPPPPSTGPTSPARRGPIKKGGAGPLARLDKKPTASGDPKRAAYEDLVWAWLNSSEFVFNH